MCPRITVINKNHQITLQYYWSFLIIIVISGKILTILNELIFLRKGFANSSGLQKPKPLFKAASAGNTEYIAAASVCGAVYYNLVNVYRC